MFTLRNWMLLLLSGIYCLSLKAEDPPLPRTVMGFYNLENGPDLWFADIHQYAAMPLEHNGLIVRYQHIDDPLPAVEEIPDLLGAVLWLEKDLTAEQSKVIDEWIRKLLAVGKKFVLMGSPPSRFYTDHRDIWRAMGLSYQDRWVNGTYNTRFTKLDPEMAAFERPYVDILYPYPVVHASEGVNVHVQASVGRSKERESVLVATTEHGGYIASHYEVYRVYEGGKEFRRWYINPFQFFKQAFQTAELPKPDVSTLAGRRIYYSHIDGDGWNSRTQVSPYRKHGMLSAEVVQKEIIEPYPELPVTVGIIAADVDPRWVGLEQSREAARAIFALPQVEAASHTYSHPFEWGFFRGYTPQSEKPFLHLYTQGSWEKGGILEKLGERIGKLDGREKKLREGEYQYRQLGESYSIPRAFANQPFSLQLEVTGSVEYLKQFLPEGKKISLYQWSGDCQPFKEALEEVVNAGVINLNGGDSRLDSFHASYSWVRPLSRTVGDFRQLYASCSNENTYTSLWTKKFYGFNQLVDTWYNTGVPFRIRPLNLYYHMYSGEKFPSLNALKQNIAYLLEQSFIAIYASHYARIIQGFYSTAITPLSSDMWRFSGRGALQTFRFDESTMKAVDFSRSKGVVGQKHELGSLYVYVDSAVDEPEIALHKNDIYYREPVAPVPYLVQSSWEVHHLQRGEKAFTFQANGFGTGEMEWIVPENGTYTVAAGEKVQHVDVQDNRLLLKFDQLAHDPLVVTVKLAAIP